MKNSIGRHPERATDDRALLDALLDEVHTGVLSSVSDGMPWAVPMLHARLGDELIVHGSTGAGMLRHITAESPVVYTVHTVDAWVVGHTTFESSANYRSATVRGVVRALDGEEKAAALDAFSDVIFPGRVAEVRPMNKKELAATSVSALRIEPGSWLYKARTGDASPAEEETTAWAGIVPVSSHFGAPVTAAWNDAEVPASIRALTRDPQ